MKDKKFIVAGVVIFIVIVTFPFWYNRGKAAPAPELQLTDKAKAAKTPLLVTNEQAQFIRKYRLQKMKKKIVG